jgi:GTP cyclohydrolase II
MQYALSIETSVAFSGQRDGVDFNAHFVTFSGFPDDVAAHAPHALVFGALDSNHLPLVRAHSGCRTGDTFGSKACDCGQQLTDTIAMMKEQGGALLYLPHHEGRGIGLNEKIKAYALMRRLPEIDTYAANRALGHDADARDYTCAAAMINALGITQLRLVTGNPEKAGNLSALGREYGFDVVETVPTRRHETSGNMLYLEAKERLGGHAFLPPDFSPRH